MSEWLVRIAIAFSFFSLGALVMALISMPTICNLEETISFWQEEYQKILGLLPDEIFRRVIRK